MRSIGKPAAPSFAAVKLYGLGRRAGRRRRRKNRLFQWRRELLRMPVGGEPLRRNAAAFGNSPALGNRANRTYFLPRDIFAGSGGTLGKIVNRSFASSTSK